MTFSMISDPWPGATREHSNRVIVDTSATCKNWIVDTKELGKPFVYVNQETNSAMSCHFCNDDCVIGMRFPRNEMKSEFFWLAVHSDAINLFFNRRERGFNFIALIVFLIRTFPIIVSKGPVEVIDLMRLKTTLIKRREEIVTWSFEWSCRLVGGVFFSFERILSIFFPCWRLRRCVEQIAQRFLENHI